ncbi:MAG: glycosyltransferase [Rhodobacter sp.]|nr:glycosyltransferase [Rhodobacter sp.]
MPRVQVLGLLRFSYPSVYNRRGEDDFEAYRATLYDPARLDRRLLWFEYVVLPSLAKQTDPDFLCPLLVGDQLPEPYRGRLSKMCAAVPQVKLCLEPEGQRHRLAVKALMEAHSDETADAVAEFQLDDDDGVADSFVEMTRAYFDLAEPLLDLHKRVTLDFCSGIMLRADAGGIALKPVQERLWTPALVTYRRPGLRTILRMVSHLELWQHMPCISIDKPPMFVRGAHEDNVSNLSKRWGKHGTDDSDPDEIAAVLRDRFGIDLVAMEKARAALP